MVSSTPTSAATTRRHQRRYRFSAASFARSGCPAAWIGTDESEAAALLRSELADRRMLVLLDNAQDAAQVRPLLPGAGRSDVIVTSHAATAGPGHHAAS